MHNTKLLFIGNHFRSQSSNPNVWHELPVRLQESGWLVLSTSDKNNRFLRLWDMLTTILIKNRAYDLAQIDLFSGLSFVWAELCVFFLNLINKPMIIVLHGGNLPSFAQRFPKRVRHLLESADTLVAPSAYLQSQLAEFHEDIQVIPNAIDISAYPFRHRTNPGPNLIWVRAFHQIYNPSLAPKILYELIKACPNAHLTMIGPDKGDGSLQGMWELAVQLEVADHITITGASPHDEIPHYLIANDIFINTTTIDNTPVSVIEAMACGLPIVTTNVGGMPWLVVDGVDGLLVPPDDPVSMADAIKQILSSTDLAASLSTNGRKKAESLDWLKILPQWEAVFEAGINNDQHP